MDRKTQWLSLAGGIFLSGIGIVKLYRGGDWTVLILGAFISAFSVSIMLKSRH